MRLSLLLPREPFPVIFGRYNLVPNGIDADFFTELPVPNTFRGQYPGLRNALVFLFLGRLAPGKGLDLLLPAFKRLLEEFGETHLVLAGGNDLDYETKVRGMLRDLGLTGRVTLTGLITGEDKLGALQDADVFVMPSRSEGVSIATLEAMYMGLPVIVTDRVGIAPEVENSRCGLVVPYDEDSLAGALKRMAAAPDRRAIGQRGRHLVASRYTTDTTARQLVAAIEEALGQLIQAGVAQEPSHPGYAGIISRHVKPQAQGSGLIHHGTELIGHKGTSVLADALLAKKCRSGGFEPDKPGKTPEEGTQEDEDQPAEALIQKFFRQPGNALHRHALFPGLDHRIVYLQPGWPRQYHGERSQPLNQMLSGNLGGAQRD